MICEKPALDVIGGGNRFSDQIMPEHKRTNELIQTE